MLDPSTQFPHVERTTTVHESYVIRTLCVNNKGEQVVRYLGTVQGMSDSGYPGWSSHADHFLTLADAQARAQVPPGIYNCYDGQHVKGSQVQIIRVTKHVVTETTYDQVETAQK